MGNTAELVDNHLHITYQYYDNGHRVGKDIIPVADIECIKAKVGPQGGMHTWSVRGYDSRYSNESYNKGKERDIELYCGDRKDKELIEQIIKLLPNCKYHEKKEDGGAPW